jgi:hypothetical protein
MQQGCGSGNGQPEPQQPPHEEGGHVLCCARWVITHHIGRRTPPPLARQVEALPERRRALTVRRVERQLLLAGSQIPPVVRAVRNVVDASIMPTATLLSAHV